MAPGRVRRTARTTRQMVALFGAIADCGDVVQDWEVTRERDGVTLRVTSREQFDDEHGAELAAKTIFERLLPDGQTPREEPVVEARADWLGEKWRGFVEISLDWL